ncbi:AAA family ATPase [Aliamphritea spongicola]|uniref:AAA family ATPase n=1 Tax=Aliamphritea spongicola TaxID=707589 RepID=UPI00196ABDC0|nr:AAA family ATPase [Aliamphritea spongicola]MBN3562699.1 AAA family ATPase [Aliamphritea spongicola]
MNHDKSALKSRSARQFSVLISGRDALMLEYLKSYLEDAGDNLKLETLQSVNGTLDPLDGLELRPDLLILHLSDMWREELQSLSLNTSRQRPQLLIIGNSEQPEMMRLAMQAGARDFLTEPVNTEDLLSTIRKIEFEKRETEHAENGALTAVINAKGGSGATMLACNLAHMMQVVSEEDVLLMDMDTQFGALAQYLNMKPENGVIEALRVVDELDVTALNAYLLRHESGLRIMGATLHELCLPSQIPEDRIRMLLDILLKNCSQLVVDVPRVIDQSTASVLTQASQVVVVVQQDYINIQDAAHLLQLLQQEMGLMDSQIVVAVNRIQKSAQISVDDIQKALNAKHIVSIANDYKHVLESLNKGEPLYEITRRAAITRSIQSLQEKLIHGFPDQKKGFLARMFSTMTGE